MVHKLIPANYYICIEATFASSLPAVVKEALEGGKP